MSIGKRVSDAIDKMCKGDAEGALFQICAAIEATAENELGKPGRGSYKDFIHQNLGLITDIAFGGRKILNLKLEYGHANLAPDADGSVSVQDIFYHVVRCGLYHTASLPDDLKFTDELQIRIENGVIVLPSSMIFGLIAAVVVSPANSGQHASKEGMLNLGEFPIPITKLWGRREELLWLLDATNEASRIQSAATARRQ